MPLVRIEILEGHSAAHKKALLDGVHSALVECFRIPQDDRCQRLHELPPERFERPPTRSVRFTSVELTVFEGRSLEAKRRLYAAIVANLQRDPGIDPADVMIVLHEPPLEDWGIRGEAACDLDLGFKVDV
jgi:phenylpyruvate tautomerase PptA (4-oxalocrotonate tautomerase family)